MVAENSVFLIVLHFSNTTVLVETDYKNELIKVHHHRKVNFAAQRNIIISATSIFSNCAQVAIQ